MRALRSHVRTHPRAHARTAAESERATPSDRAAAGGKVRFRGGLLERRTQVRKIRLPGTGRSSPADAAANAITARMPSFRARRSALQPIAHCVAALHAANARMAA